MTTATEALKEARMALDSLGGLWVTDATEDNPHGEAWQIDTTKTVNKIEQALAVSERSLSERIEAAYDEVISQRHHMQQFAIDIADAEETAKMDSAEAYISAKNGEVRQMVVLDALAEDEAYHEARRFYRDARNSFRLQMLEIERLKLLAELAKAGD